MISKPLYIKCLSLSLSGLRKIDWDLKRSFDYLITRWIKTFQRFPNSYWIAIQSIHQVKNTFYIMCRFSSKILSHLTPYLFAYEHILVSIQNRGDWCQQTICIGMKFWSNDKITGSKALLYTFWYMETVSNERTK